MTTFATATTAAATPRRTRSRAANVALWTLQVVIAVIYAFSAFGKLTAEAQNVAGFQAMGLGNTGMNMAIAPASSSEPMMYIPVLPRPMAWNPATFWASAVSLPNAEKA